jgi:betaine-homocysteine S-methyltransferase
VNCLRPPEHTLPIVREMLDAVDVPVAAQPTAYRTTAEQPDFTALPEFPLGLDPLQLSRREMAEYAVQAREMGVRFIGSCCGSVATHVREMGRALGKVSPEEGEWRVDYDRPMSAYEYYGHRDRT